MTVIDFRYLTLVIPYQVGTMRRRGKPWCGSSGWPFASQARITPSASASLTGSARSARAGGGTGWRVGRQHPEAAPLGGGGEGLPARVVEQARLLEQRLQGR